MENPDQIELVFEKLLQSQEKDTKPYKVIKIKLNENIRLSKYILKRVLVKKNQFENYPIFDRFLN